MEHTLCKSFFFFLFLLFLSSTVVRSGGEAASEGLVEGPNTGPSPAKIEPPRMNVVKGAKTDKKEGSGSGGGGGVGWGWGMGGGGGNRYGGWGWGSGGGGGFSWRWGCGAHKRARGGKRSFNVEGDFKIGQYAQCMLKGACSGMRLDCPLHCGGGCVYDCRHMCKAHCNH